MSYQGFQGNQNAALQQQLQRNQQEIQRLQQQSAARQTTIQHQDQILQGHRPGMPGPGGFIQPPHLQQPGHQTGAHQAAPLQDQLQRSRREIQRLQQQLAAQGAFIHQQSQAIQGHRPGIPTPGGFLQPHMLQQQGVQAAGPFTITGGIPTTRVLLERLFRLAFLWSVAHVNIVHDEQWVAGMPEGHLAVFADPVLNKDPDEMWRLLNHKDTRPLLGQRYIIEWTLLTLVRASSLAGFPSARALDNQILQNQEATYDNTPQALRTHYTTDSARCLQDISRLPGFQQHLQSKSQYHGDLLWELLKGMMYRKTTADWKDLHEYMREAQRLPLQMFIGAEQYSSEYFQPGIPFNPAKMENKTPALSNFTPAQLQAQNRVVRLVMTPLIEVGIPDANGNIQKTMIVRAGVYLYH